MTGNNPIKPAIKICGITNLQDARFVAGALVDYMGFIFFEKSSRYIDPAQAGAIINWLEGPTKVGVFVNQPLDDVNRISVETGIDMVQLHGEESPEYCSLVEKPVIKTIHIEEDTTEKLLKYQIKQYAPVSQFLLFDTKTEDLWGGTGKTFDWTVLKDVGKNIKFFLSGGLSSANIKHAIEITSPDVVDICSSLESEPGLKDFTKIEELMVLLDH